MIVNQIRKHLETGKLKIGDRLPSERELCKMFGVGRSSVREAIRALVVMGNLEVIQGKGTFLCQSEEASDQSSLLEKAMAALPFFDLMEAREILEIKVVQLAAERVDKADILRIHKAINRMAESTDVKTFLNADLDFHNALTESTGNLVIREMMKVITRMLYKDSYFVAISVDTRENSINTARQIVQCVARGEAEKAGEAMRVHLRAVDAKLKDFIAETAKGGKAEA